LDNTLWPGTLGEATALSQLDQFWGPYAGLHQALKIMKHRGILLATCSKNDADDAMRHWMTVLSQDEQSSNGTDTLLRPDDFVLHKINWRRKSENVADISQMLGVAPSAMLFIDDSPVERAEVAASFPTIRLLGADMNLVRKALLEDPCLDVSVKTDEAGRRTEMTRAQLEREDARERATDEPSFLRSLNIMLRIARVIENDNIARVVELIQRTTQFNTTLVRYDAETIRELTGRERSHVYTLEVTDRYTCYGIVGVCIVLEGDIVVFLMSCRVIGLHVAVPFLKTVLKVIRETEGDITGRIVEGERNEPCRTVFKEAGFSHLGNQVFVLRRGEGDLQIDESVYKVLLGDSTDRAMTRSATTSLGTPG
jgi:FkbH-like protein